MAKASQVGIATLKTLSILKRTTPAARTMINPLQLLHASQSPPVALRLARFAQEATAGGQMRHPNTK